MFRLLLVLLLLSVAGHTQEITNMKGEDSTAPKTLPPIYARGDVAILILSSDNWTDLPAEIESKPLRSRGFSFLFMTERMNRSSTFGIGGGLGFMSQNVHTNANIIDTGNASFLAPIADSLKLELNKLSSNYITAALEIRLRSKENDNGGKFKLSVGMQAGYLVQSHTKYEDMNGKYKGYYIGHLNKFQYGVYGRLGYNKFAVNGYFSLAPLFQDGEGPEMMPYSVGVALTL